MHQKQQWYLSHWYIDAFSIMNTVSFYSSPYFFPVVPPEHSPSITLRHCIKRHEVFTFHSDLKHPCSVLSIFCPWKKTSICQRFTPTSSLIVEQSSRFKNTDNERVYRSEYNWKWLPFSAARPPIGREAKAFGGDHARLIPNTRKRYYCNSIQLDIYFHKDYFKMCIHAH